MARWQPNTRERLTRAALDLFCLQGFAETTVPEITARAGLTTRTFFRYFADKREVLFAGEEISGIAAGLAAAPPELGPVELLIGGLHDVAETRFEGRREELRTRRTIVASDDGLRERELRKWASLRDAVGDGLRARGVGATQARLLAGTAVTLLQVALEDWLDADDDQPLVEHVDGGLALLRAALA
ncbi:TetR family transcriptional regulator [Pseudonocardia xishanensis]|uniref:TetR family transcriptional regulator n=1 Tax=Pseudonocardia xishanensis TaxID=630995 RepID=A0ABP8S4F6_9PSEU